MPVGQAVIATSVLGCSASGASAGFARRRGLRGRCGRRGRVDHAVDQPTTSSGVDALRSDSTNSLRTSARARLDSSFMCSAPPASGAAIRKARSAGPSGAPKSTGGLQPGETDRGGVDVRRAAVRDRDAAGQPGGRLGFARHRGGDQSLGVGGAPGVGEPVDEPADHRLLVGAGVDVEQDQIGVDDRLRGVSWSWRYFRVGCYELAGVGEIEVTRTASRSIWAGEGSAEPGSAAAALP